METTKAIIRTTLKSLAILAVASLLARIAIISGLVRAGLDSYIGDAIDTSLRTLFNISGCEEAETLIISVALITCILLVTALHWLLSELTSRWKARKSN
ncbi:hypothetical protein BKM07_06390 [Pseudomonas syringae group genomosp. 3]|uniref:Secreted protein n=1 Tax=Pseudomonas syringae group genomosp. 3 TaxID=251701 RepID=A0ABD6VIG8_9PSED|nr:hypothetical protein [Pseudomonas syringae group genomosp. 3]MCF5240516.1 hypothetical protein [Pseudomonas syringae]POD71804.1 hypothetical protein BKM07_06390 [Pseudomonas syringae group genomosp. 3]